MSIDATDGPIEGAVFYDEPEAETLIHRTLADAVECVLDAAWEPDDGDAYEPAIERIAPLTIVGYRPVTPSDGVIGGIAWRAASDALDRATDDYDYEYGGEHWSSFDVADIEQARAIIEEAIRQMLSTITPHACEPCGRVVLSAEEVRAVMERQRCG
jgi:hypothetical protein